MHAMISASSHATKPLHLIQLAIFIAVGNAIKPTLHLSLVVIHRHVKRIEGEEHSINGPNIEREFFNV